MFEENIFKNLNILNILHIENYICLSFNDFETDMYT